MLASGYVFTAFITVAHVLTFPGVFSPTGLFGASRQSAVWLYVLWHGGFPLFVMAYALLKDEQRELIASSRLPHTRAGVAIASSVAAVFLLVCGLTLLATANLNSFPAALQKIVSAPRGDGSGAQILIPLFAADWILGLVAIIVLWRRRPHTLLDLWLIVVMCAWLFDIALSGLLARARFDLGWYGGRIYALVAANAVLVVLLIETGKLYTQLVRAHAGERQERRLVHERTVELMVVNKQLDASMTALRESEANLAQRVREKTAELSESEARYRSYFESSLDAQFLAAPDGSILDVNSAACQMLGRPAEEIKRLGRKAVVDMTDPRLHAALVERARAGGMRAEITMIRADGTTFPAEVASSAFIDAAGLPKTTVSMRDITERKQAESRIQTQLEHLSLLDQITRSKIGRAHV